MVLRGLGKRGQPGEVVEGRSSGVARGVVLTLCFGGDFPAIVLIFPGVPVIPLSHRRQRTELSSHDAHDARGWGWGVVFVDHVGRGGPLRPHLIVGLDHRRTRGGRL